MSTIYRGYYIILWKEKNKYLVTNFPEGSPDEGEHVADSEG